MGHPKVVIIGGGFCGLMTAYHVIKNAAQPLDVTLVNSGYATGKGVAYGTQCEKFLLNVPAAKMSALPAKPDHFLNWLHERAPYNQVDKDTLGKTFVARKIYGAYLEDIYNELLKEHGKCRFTSVEDFAGDITKTDGRYIIDCSSGEKLIADAVVLATGNEIPGNPALSDPSFYQSTSYFNNPWNEDSFLTANKEGNILIVGNGLTMVDTVLGLMDQKFKGTIYSISPHGFTILPHRHAGMIYTKLLEEIEEPLTLTGLYTLFKKHMRILRQFGLSAEPLVDSVRPLAQEIWKKLDIHDRKRFLNHIRHLWGVARHRLPLHIYDFMQNLRIKGKLVVHRGKLISITESGNEIEVVYEEGKNGKRNTITVGRVINCTGPSLNIKKSRNSLISRMVEKGMIRPDALYLGIDTDQHGNLITESGELLPSVFTLGGNLRGLLWESTAVPELRAQAAALGTHLLKTLHKEELTS